MKPIVLHSSLPVACLITYAGLRLFHIQPPMETGVSEFLSSGAFLFGSAFCYFAAGVFAVADDMRQYRHWLAASGLMFLLGIDESFMVHEQVGGWLLSVTGDQFLPGIDWAESAVFGVYGVALICVLFMFRKARMPFWVLVALFSVFCGIAQAADSFGGGEGLITVAGRDVDYEQAFEAVGAMFLAAAFGYHAAASLEPMALTVGKTEGNE